MVIQYGYARVSTKDQHLERQLTAIKKYAPGISDNNIFIDKKTGKDFEREQYQAMKVILEHLSKASSSSDSIELIIEEMDRLGRNATGIKKELLWFKEHNIIVRILEIPTTLLDVDQNNKWVTELINSLLIEVYSAIAEQELEKREKRQAEGIAEAKKKGVYKGRKPIEVNESMFKQVYAKWKASEITARQAMKELGLKPNTFYRRVKEYEQSISEKQ